MTARQTSDAAVRAERDGDYPTAVKAYRMAAELYRQAGDSNAAECHDACANEISDYLAGGQSDCA